jgi:hypothetical protein
MSAAKTLTWINVSWIYNEIMNKKIIILLSIFSLVLVSAKCPPVKLKRLTVINKSAMAIEISMTGKELEKSYYLRIPEGSQKLPAETEFTVWADTYTSSIYYVELWDPVYGATCSNKSQSLDLTHDVRVTVLPCLITPPNGGEPPSIIKYAGRNTRTGNTRRGR